MESNEQIGNVWPENGLNDENDRVLVLMDVRNFVCGQCADYSNTRADLRKFLYREILKGRECVDAVAVDNI